MCQIVLQTLFLVALFFSLVGQSVTHTVGTSAQAIMLNGPLSVVDLDNTKKRNEYSQSLNYSIDGLFKYYSFQLGATTTQKNYSNVFLQDSVGNEKALDASQYDKNEILLDLGLGFTKGSWRLEVNWSGLVSESPYPFQSMSVGLHKGFFENSTIVGTQLAYLDQSSPESYFLSTDFVLEKRPETVEGLGFETYLEQVLSETLKGRMTIGLGQRKNERPMYYLMRAQIAYAPLDTVFLQIEGNYAQELKSDPLLNERGYFYKKGYQATVTWEPLYDFLISASYGLNLENEKDPRLSRHISIGSDHYGFGAKYLYDTIEFSLDANYIATNTASRDLTLGGGVTWEF